MLIGLDTAGLAKAGFWDFSIEFGIFVTETNGVSFIFMLGVNSTQNNLIIQANQTFPLTDVTGVVEDLNRQTAYFFNQNGSIIMVKKPNLKLNSDLIPFS